MSQENHEQRIERLEKLFENMGEVQSATALLSTNLAGAFKNCSQTDCLLFEQTLALNDLNLWMMRFFLSAGLINQPTVRQTLLDAIARAEMHRDFVAAKLNEIKAGFNNPPPPPLPPGS